MRGRDVALIASLALLVGGVAGFLYASLRSPEPSTVPAIEVEDEPSAGKQPGGRRQGPGKRNEQTRSGGAPGGSGQAPGARPVPPPPPAAAGTGDDDDDDEPEDHGDDDAAEADDST